MARQFFVGGNFKLNPVTREEKKKLRPRWDARVYAVNCLTYVQVGAFPFGVLFQYES